MPIKTINENPRICGDFSVCCDCKGNPVLPLTRKKFQFLSQFFLAVYPAGIRAENFQILAEIHDSDEWIVPVAAVAKVNEPDFVIVIIFITFPAVDRREGQER